MVAMSLVESPEYPVFNAGIDWVTSFNADNFNINLVAEYMETVFDDLKNRGHHISKSVRMGHVGRSTEGAFHGFNEKRTLAILSSDLAREFGAGLIKLSQKTSRIDLQVTVDTCAERPVLSKATYYFATQSDKRRGRPRELKLTITHPQGDTLNVNKRTSDSYGRLYDWGAAHKMGEKHRYWRFEVETKRHYCDHVASLINRGHDTQDVSARLVFDWWKERTFSPPFKPAPLSCSQERNLNPPRPGVLAWFEDSVSVTVARSIRDFGLQRTLKALRLDSILDANTERR